MNAASISSGAPMLLAGIAAPRPMSRVWSQASLYLLRAIWVQSGCNLGAIVTLLLQNLSLDASFFIRCSYSKVIYSSKTRLQDAFLGPSELCGGITAM